MKTIPEGTRVNVRKADDAQRRWATYVTQKEIVAPQVSKFADSVVVKCEGWLIRAKVADVA